MKTKVYSYLELLQEKGNSLREPYSKFIGDGIFELRVIVSNNITRFLYFFIQDKRIVLTNGFVKKTRKTPSREVRLARRYRKDYLERTQSR